MGSHPTRNREFQKNGNKIQKIKKSTIMASFQAKIGWKIIFIIFYYGPGGNPSE